MYGEMKGHRCRFKSRRLAGLALGPPNCCALQLQWCQGRTHPAPFKRVRGNAAAASAADAACGLTRLGGGRGRGRLSAAAAPAPRGWAAPKKLVAQSLEVVHRAAVLLLRSGCNAAALVRHGLQEDAPGSLLAGIQQRAGHCKAGQGLPGEHEGGALPACEGGRVGVGTVGGSGGRLLAGSSAAAAAGLVQAVATKCIHRSTVRLGGSGRGPTWQEGEARGTHLVIGGR